MRNDPFGLLIENVTALLCREGPDVSVLKFSATGMSHSKIPRKNKNGTENEEKDRK